MKYAILKLIIRYLPTSKSIYFNDIYKRFNRNKNNLLNIRFH